MRKSLILMILVSMALAAPAMADGWRGDSRDKAPRVERKEQMRAHHDRDANYGRFQKRMQHLRKELRHERRENRRYERQERRHRERVAWRHERRHEQRHVRHLPAPWVVAPRRAVLPLLFPQVVVHIPLGW